MMRKTALFVAACLALSISALAQGSQPQCTLSVSPTSGALTFTAKANCTDPGNDITSVSLDWGDGSAPFTTPLTTFQVSHTYVAGTYTITLTATDSTGLNSSPQTATVVANLPPTCTLTSVSPTSGTPPLSVAASGTCSDPESDISSTNINWGDGTTTPGTTGSHTYTKTGTFSVTLSAQDTAGNTGTSAPKTVVVSKNQPPVCSLSVAPDHGQPPLAVTANASCTDPENDITGAILDWGDGTPTTTLIPGVTTYGHTYTIAGTFTVTLTATDSAGNTASAPAVKIKVSSVPNAPPTCALAVVPTAGQAPLMVTATPSCTDPENDITTETLSWGDGAPIAVTNGIAYTHTYTASGTFTITLTATDVAGNHGTATQKVSVTGGPPASTPTCTVTTTPTSGTAPLLVTVNALCNDPQNDITSIVTNFGDGYYLVGPNPSHSFVNGGTYTLTVVASDKAGNTSKPVSQTVTVTNTSVLFVAVSNGQVTQFTESGSNQNTLNSNQGGSITGMGFDATENLYTSDFTADTVSKFSGNGALMGTFGSGYNCKPESVVFDNSGNAYVGETGCSHALLKFDAYGNLENAFSVSTEQEGSDWIDLAPDQCTIFYTSQGGSVLRYNTCTKQQLPTFATGLSTGLAVKILPDGGALVAEKNDVVRFDQGGRKIMTYTASSESCFVSLALDSDNTTFWAADYCSSDVVRFDLNSGNEITKFNSGTPANTVYGVAERVSPPKMAPAGPLIPNPAQASVSGGQNATFTLNFAPNSAAAGHTFTLACADLPANSSCSFSPATLTGGSSGLTAQLTITTTGAAARLHPPRGSSRWVLALALPCFGVIMAFAGGEPDERRRRLVLLALLLVCLVPLFSCSGASGSSSSSSPPSSSTAPPTPGTTTPSGTYTVVVHATSAAGAQSSTAVSLTVQ